MFNWTSIFWFVYMYIGDRSIQYIIIIIVWDSKCSANVASHLNLKMIVYRQFIIIYGLIITLSIVCIECVFETDSCTKVQQKPMCGQFGLKDSSMQQYWLTGCTIHAHYSCQMNQPKICGDWYFSINIIFSSFEHRNQLRAFAF